MIILARDQPLKYKAVHLLLQQKLINIQMGGTNSQPVNTTVAFKIESQGLAQSTTQTLENQFKGTYHSFIKRLMVKSQIQDLPILAEKETLYLGSNTYINKYTNKKTLKTQLENFVLSSLANYVSYPFCIAISKLILLEINLELKNNPKQLKMGQNKSYLVLGDSGCLYKTNFQVGYGFIDKEGEDSATYVGIYNGISVINIQSYEVEVFSQQLDDVLSPFNIAVDEDITQKLNQIYNSKNNPSQRQIVEGGQKKQSKLKKFGKTAFSIMEKIAMAMSVMKPLIFKEKQQQKDQNQEGGQMNVSDDPLWIQERPDSQVSPLWRVGLITATFLADKVKTSFSFTGTILDEYAVLTSTNILLKAYNSKSGQLSQITIKLEDERKPRRINKNLIDLKNLTKDSYYFLFLDRPCWSSLAQNTQFVTSFVQDPSTLYGIQNNKIYMCGYNNGGKDAKQQHQASRVLSLYQTHFIDGFRKNEFLVGAPIYYFEPENSIFNIFGVNHSSLQNISNIFKPQYSRDDKISATSFASELILKKWFYIRTKYDVVKTEFRLKSATTKENIYKEHEQPAQSLQYQIQKRKIRAASCIHSIGIIEVSNNFGTTYGLGVQMLSPIKSQGQNQPKKQLNMLTLSKYVEDTTKIIRVYVKKFVETQQDPLEFELRRTNKYNTYFVTQINKVAGQEQLSILRLSNMPTADIWIRTIKQDQLENLYPLSGFILSIDKQVSSGLSVRLKMTLLEQHDVLELYKKKQKTNPFVEGLLFASQRSQIQWIKHYEFFYGFYQEGKNAKGGSGQICYMEKGRQITQAVALSDERRIISDTNRVPYKSIGIIMTKFNIPETIIRVGTCSLVKGSDPSKTFLITCAHNIVYNTNDKIISWHENFEQNVKIFLGKIQQIPWKFSELQNRFSNQKQIIKNIHVHKQYIQNLHKQVGPNQLKLSNFFDIAVIQIGFDDQIGKLGGGFVIKPNKPDQNNKLFTKNIQIAGYPAKEDKFGSRFGVLYTEAVKFHDVKYQPTCYQVLTQNKETIIKHKLSTLSGNSGSPIFYPINQKQYGIVGIHIAGVYRTEQTFNLGSFIYNKKVFSWLSDIPGLISK